MRSIRLSLLLYFLGLLALAVGTASVLAYQTAQRTLEAKKETTIKLIETQYKERCLQEERRLDGNLLMQAQAVAGLVRHSDWHRFHRYYALGLLSSNLAPSGYLLAPSWVGESVNSRLFWEMFRKFVPVITLKEEYLINLEEPADYIQVNASWTPNSYRSASLGSDSFDDPTGFAQDDVLHSEVNEVFLPSGKEVRRLLLKTSALIVGRRGPRDPSRPPGSSLPPSQERSEPRPPPPDRSEGRPFRPSLYIQCAYDSSRYHDRIAEFAQRRDQEIAVLNEEIRDAQTSVLRRLLLIGSLTFLAALAGSFWLVYLGLAPLQQLSRAVSQVSPRDFRLPLEGRKLPSELKPIVQRLEETLDLLKRAFAREKQATADISHELRTPLAAMLTTTELALRKQRTPEQYRELLQDCRTSAQQMNEIVNRLLTLARLDAGVDQVRRQTIDVARLAEQCATLVRPLAEAQGLTLTVDHVPAVPAQTDPDKLREVLNNLLHNAIQYNRPQGKIALRVGQNKDQLWMEVADTGIGISPEARTQIFERFYRADPSRGGDGLHAGLGLAVVKEYVDLMGGRIDVESQEGQGSTFRIWLPA